jgi:hypothetical protein
MQIDRGEKRPRLETGPSSARIAGECAVWHFESPGHCNVFLGRCNVLLARNKMKRMFCSAVAPELLPRGRRLEEASAALSALYKRVNFKARKL